MVINEEFLRERSYTMMASEETFDWLRRYYSLVDAERMDESATFFAEDAKLRFANNEPIVGREGIDATLRGLVESLDGIRHDLKDAWEEEAGVLIYEVDVTYTRKDGGVVTCHGAVVSEVEDELFQEQRIYVDITPVFADMGAA